MYLVVRSDLELSSDEALQAAVSATLACVERFEHDPLHAAAFADWFALSFRKVCLSANPRLWARMNDELDCPGSVARVRGAAAVICLPPLLKSAQPPVLRRMQSLKGELELGEREAPGEVLFALNAEAPMSLGKALAQAAHAALMLVRSPLAAEPRYAAALAGFARSGRACFLAPTRARWLELRELNCVLVRDAGLTEVAPGSETVLAAPPGQQL